MDSLLIDLAPRGLAIQQFRELETPDARYVSSFIMPRPAWMLVPGMPSLEGGRMV